MNYMIFHPGGNVAIVVDTVVYDIAVAMEKFPDITNDLVASGVFMEDGVLVGDHYYTGNPEFEFTLNMYNDYPEEYLVQDVVSCAKEFGATLSKRQFNWCYLSCYSREDAIAFQQWCQTSRPGWLVVVPEEPAVTEEPKAEVEEPEADIAEVEESPVSEEPEEESPASEEPEAEEESPASEEAEEESSISEEPEVEEESPISEEPEAEPEEKSPASEEAEEESPVSEEVEPEADIEESSASEEVKPVSEEDTNGGAEETGEVEAEPVAEFNIPMAPEPRNAKEVMFEKYVEFIQGRERPTPADAILDEEGIKETVITPSMSLEEAEAFVDQPEEEEKPVVTDSFVIPEECRGETWAQTWKHCRPQDVVSDVFCVEKNWEKRGEYYIIDCVMTGMRLIHSDKQGINVEVSAKECR